MEKQIINEMLSDIARSYQPMKDNGLFLHPIATESIRHQVIDYLFKCIEEGVGETECVEELTKKFKFKDKCEHCGFSETMIFNEVIRFAYRVLKEYKELTNT
mgnify:CR=1 FL=1